MAVKHHHRSKHLRRAGMMVLSMPTGAGGAERNWADVKVVLDKKKAATPPRARGKGDPDLRHSPARPGLVGKDVVKP